MNVIAKFSAVALAAAALAPTSAANGRHPGSVLVYPVQYSGLDNSVPTGASNYFWTIACVTNSNLTPATPFSFGGSTNVQFDYVNTLPDPSKPLKPLHCYVNDVVEFLTPADTFCVLTNCHNASSEAGYLVVHAQDPSKFKTAWSWDYLMGSEMVVTASGGMYAINAISFASPLADGAETDLDGDGQLDFDGAEYQGIADILYIDSFLAVANSSLTLINMTGGVDFTATVKFDIWNDNEFPLSATVAFRCWFNQPLSVVSQVFSEYYLRNNTPNDPSELDINCDNIGDFETGWAKIRGLVASSTSETIPDPALLGAITSGPEFLFDGGRLLWESEAKQLNGDFIKFGVDDPEFP
jgi:hypothetical protein